MNPLVGLFYVHPEALLPMAPFLQPKDCARLARTCIPFKKIITSNELYWKACCLHEGYQARKDESSYLTFCRIENVLYRRGQTLNNLKVTLQCSLVSSEITGIEGDPTYQRRAVNPLNGNLLCMKSVPDGAFLERDPHVSLPTDEILCDTLLEIGADDGKIVTSSRLPGLFSSNFGHGIEKMKVVSNKILLISNQIFFSIDLQSLQIIKKIELSSHLSNCTDVTEHEGTYLFLNFKDLQSQIYSLEESSNQFTCFGPSIQANLRFNENMQKSVTCFNLSQIYQEYFISRNDCTSRSLHLLRGGADLEFFYMDPDDGIVTCLDPRFTVYAFKKHNQMFLWDRRRIESHAIKTPPCQSTFHIGVRDEDLILYIDSKIYSIKTSSEQHQS